MVTNREDIGGYKGREEKFPLDVFKTLGRLALRSVGPSIYSKGPSRNFIITKEYFPKDQKEGF